MQKSPTYFALLEACALDGCPVCRLSYNSVNSYLESFFTESVNDVEMRTRLRESLGYCREHVRFMLEARTGDPLSFSIIYQDILGNVLKGLPQGGASGLGDRLAFSVRRTAGGQTRQAAETEALLTPSAPCPVCEEQASSEKVILGTLVKSVVDTPMQQALVESHGLCLPHLNDALQAAAGQETFVTLVRLARQNLEGLNAELAEFIRKSDYRFAAEAVGQEGDAWKRALALASGNFVDK